MKCKLLLRLHGKPKEKLTNGCRLYMSGNYALKHRAVCSKRSEYTECIKSVKLWVVHFYCTLMALRSSYAPDTTEEVTEKSVWCK